MQSTMNSRLKSKRCEKNTHTVESLILLFELFICDEEERKRIKIGTHKTSRQAGHARFFFKNFEQHMRRYIEGMNYDMIYGTMQTIAQVH